jgi:uncharacterized protein (TIGR02246 family)
MANADEGAIRSVIDSYAERLRAADVDGAVALFTKTAALMVPDQDTAVGAQQLTAAFRSGFEEMQDIDATFEVQEILVRGDLAAARTSSTDTVTMRATGQRLPMRFRELFVLERTNGQWKIAQYMFQPLNHQ